MSCPYSHVFFLRQGQRPRTVTLQMNKGLIAPLDANVSVKDPGMPWLSEVGVFAIIQHSRNMAMSAGTDKNTDRMTACGYTTTLFAGKGHGIGVNDCCLKETLLKTAPQYIPILTHIFSGPWVFVRSLVRTLANIIFLVQHDDE